MLFGKPVGTDGSPSRQPANAFSFGQPSGFGQAAFGGQSSGFGQGQPKTLVWGKRSQPDAAATGATAPGGVTASFGDAQGSPGSFGQQSWANRVQGGRGRGESASAERIQAGRGGRGEGAGRGRAASTWQRNQQSPGAATPPMTSDSEPDGDDASKKAKRLARFQGAGGGGSEQQLSSQLAFASPAVRGLKRSAAQHAMPLDQGSPLDMSVGGGADDGMGGMSDDGGMSGRSTPAWGGMRASSPVGTPMYTGGGGGDDADDLYIVGTCEYMCPVEERNRRVTNNELHPLEKPQEGNPHMTLENLVVKRALRNYDDIDKKPESFRTFSALSRTMKHLVNVMDWTAEDHPPATPSGVHAFIWDRQREVRKELRAQRFHTNPQTLPHVIEWVEWVARYLLMSGHDLIEVQGFQAQLNQEQMNKCMMDLMEFYSTAHSMGLTCPNSAEFKSYLIIMNYGGLINKAGNRNPNKAAATELMRSLTPMECASPWVHVMLLVLGLLSKDDVVGFWKLTRSSPYLLACVLYTQFGGVQTSAMALIAHAFDASHDPNNTVPVTALTPYLTLGHKAIASKARMAGAQQLGNINDPANVEFRFSDYQHRPNVAGVKRSIPWITKLLYGPRSEAATQPAPLTQEFLDLVAVLGGRQPGSIPATGGPVPRVRSPAPAAMAWPAARPAQPRLTPTVSPSSVTQAPVQPPSQAPPSMVFGLQASTKAAKKDFNTIPTSTSQAAPAGQSTPFGAGNASQGWFAAAHEQQAQQQQQLPPELGNVWGANRGMVEVGAQGVVGTSNNAAAAAALNEKVAAATQAAARYRADAEAARQLQQQAQIQSQTLQHQVMEAHQQRMHFESLQRASAHQAAQLQHQLALQAQQLEALAAEKALAEMSLAKRVLKEKEAEIRQGYEQRLQARAIQCWLDALQERRVQNARLRDQMERCHIARVARGGSTTISSLISPSIRSSSVTLRGSPAVGVPVSAKRRCRRLSAPEEVMLTSVVAPPQPLEPPLPLRDIVMPTLKGALAKAGWRYDAVHAQLAPEPALWKLVVCTGLERMRVDEQQQQQPQQEVILSNFHELAGLWLRQKLSCGREGGTYQPPAGTILSLQYPPPSQDITHDTPPLATTRIALCVQDVCAAGVASEPVIVPEHSSSTMSATSAILLLADGPGERWTPPPEPLSPTRSRRPPTSPRASGGGCRHLTQHDGPPLPTGLSRELDAALSRTWEQLRQLLSRLPPQVRVPVVVVSLAGEAGAAAVTAHLASTASHWSGGLTSRMATCTVLPLLPMSSAPGVLIQALHQLAAFPPAPFCLSAGCPDTTPASNPNSPRWAAQGAGRIGDVLNGSGTLATPVVCVSGPPRRLAVDGLVTQLLEQCLEEHQPKLWTQQDSAGGLQDQGPQSIVMSFNRSLEALSRGIHASASHTIASWGLPAPELTRTQDACAPTCWVHDRVQHAADAVLRVRFPLSQLPPADPTNPQAAFSATVSLLWGTCQRWAETERQATGGLPILCTLLPRYQPAAVAHVATQQRPASLPFTWVSMPATKAHAAAAHPRLGWHETRDNNSHDNADAYDTRNGSLSPRRLVEDYGVGGKVCVGAASPLFMGAVRPALPTPYTAQRPTHQTGGSLPSSPWQFADTAAGVADTAGARMGSGSLFATPARLASPQGWGAEVGVVGGGLEGSPEPGLHGGGAGGAAGVGGGGVVDLGWMQDVEDMVKVSGLGAPAS